MDGFERELLGRLPLAEAILLLLSHLFEDDFLDGLYEQHRGRCYERELTFPALLNLLKDTLLRYGGSARQSMAQAQAQGKLPVDQSNVYGKLSRLPMPLSEALLQQCTARLEGLWPKPPLELPVSLAAFNVVALDGKTLKHVTRRLKPCRGLSGKLLGGKLLVAMCLRRGIALGMAAHADGQANEVPLVKGLLERLPAASPTLWVADRQFCDLLLPRRFTARADHFLIRYSRNVAFEPDLARPQRQGIDKQGRSFIEQWGWLGAKSNPKRRYVRRITLMRPGEQEVSLVSDLLDEQAYPAQALLEVYLMRWGIERMFQQVTEVFDLRHLVGCTPQAMVFQASLCLLLYNLTQVVRTHVAQDGGQAVEEVSGELLFREVKEQFTAVMAAADLPRLIETLHVPLALSLSGHLKRLTRGQWQERYRKSKRSTRYLPVKHSTKSPSGTWSVAKVLRTSNGLKPAKPPPQRKTR